MNLNIEFEHYYLDNGLRVILHQDEKTPIVSINLWYHVGSKNEVPGKTGYAHLFEHMMFQGSAHVPSDMHFQLIQSAGGTLNGSTFFDRTNYFETLPSHYLELGLWLESDRMGYMLPALTNEKLATQVQVVKNERRQRVDNQPYGLWLEKILELAYPASHPYHWPVIGYMKDLDHATLDDIGHFFRTFYAPNNASLVLAGDFETTQAKDLIEKYFAEIPSLADKPELILPGVPYNTGEKRTVLKDRVQLPRVYMAYHIPPIGETDNYAADILSDVLSEGKSSRLYRSLIYNQQIAQDAQALVLPMQETSLFLFMVTAAPGVSAERIEKALQIEIDSLVQDGVSADELQRTKNQIEARKIRDLQSVGSRADNLNMYAVYFDAPEMLNTEIEHYRRIDISQLQQTARTYLTNENRVLVQFIPEA